MSEYTVCKVQLQDLNLTHINMGLVIKHLPNIASAKSVGKVVIRYLTYIGMMM